MYLRAVHADLHIPHLRQFIQQNPLGLFISAIQSEDFPIIQCTHIPWLLDLQSEASDTEELGILRGHMAKPNPHTKALVEAIQRQSPKAVEDGFGDLEGEVSIMFTGSVHSYVTPQFYTETKPTTGKVVPTWNYAAVQAYGKLKAYWDTHSEVTDAFLVKAVDDLTKHAEHNLKQNGRKDAWEVSDAPESYVNLMKKNIIGLEIEITRLEGKWKVNQELNAGDREGVIKGFGAIGTDDGRAMAKMVDERGKMKDAAAAARKAS